MQFRCMTIVLGLKQDAPTRIRYVRTTSASSPAPFRMTRLSTFSIRDAMATTPGAVLDNYLAFLQVDLSSPYVCPDQFLETYLRASL